ncbi:putative protein OS=Bosea thiooxidans OX=53254 GN=SAMN05660750_04018 PE=4 SV=1 [Bosea thiooxidans]|uniref:Uncharacterized protein n=1 Tax=Bosea thiooxidans TaxID=53254 RepID=A0A1T5GGS6_9HYPH|nr:hypothetical protein SAMN05660750_04018 [Bosea thiooxidans]
MLAPVASIHVLNTANGMVRSVSHRHAVTIQEEKSHEPASVL